MFLITNDFWQIKKTKDKGFGVFAKKEIITGTIIGDYLGKVIKTAEYDLEKDRFGLYLMYYSDEASIYPNLKKPGPHLLNHSCTPNCWIYIHRGHTLFFTLRKIKIGEELTISYLLSPKDENCKDCPHDCKCKSASCTGTMHLAQDKYEKWQQFQNLKKKKTKTPKPVFGKNLSKLPTYPKTIPNNPIYTQISNN